MFFSSIFRENSFIKMMMLLFMNDFEVLSAKYLWVYKYLSWPVLLIFFCGGGLSEDLLMSLFDLALYFCKLLSVITFN